MASGTPPDSKMVSRLFEEVIEVCELEKMSRHWTKATGLRQAEWMAYHTVGCKSGFIMPLRRLELSILRTGQCPLNYHHLLSASNVWRLCKELVQTTEHIMCSYCEKSGGNIFCWMEFEASWVILYYPKDGCELGRWSFKPYLVVIAI